VAVLAGALGTPMTHAPRRQTDAQLLTVSQVGAQCRQCVEAGRSSIKSSAPRLSVNDMAPVALANPEAAVKLAQIQADNSAQLQ